MAQGAGRRRRGTSEIGVLWSTTDLRSTILRQPGRGLASVSRPHAEPADVDDSLRRIAWLSAGSHPHAFAVLPWSACRPNRGPSDAPPPRLGPRLEIVPGELTGVLGLELVVER